MAAFYCCILLHVVACMAIRSSFVDQTNAVDPTVASRLEETMSGMWLAQDPDVFSSDSTVKIGPFTDEKLLFGADVDRHHFVAQSDSFADNQAGQRILTVTELRAFPRGGGGEIFAFLEQRSDLMHDLPPTGGRGQLVLGSDDDNAEQWMILWDDNTQWIRHPSQSEVQTELNPEKNARRHAQQLTSELLAEWSRDCAKDTPGVPFHLGVTISTSIGADLKNGGINSAISAGACASSEVMKHHASSMQCITDRVQKYAESQNKGLESFKADMFATVATTLQKFMGPGIPDECFPTLCLTLTFSIMPYPPFVDPVPALTLSFSMPLSLKEIYQCAKGLNITEVIMKAWNAKPESPEIAETSEKARAEVDKQSPSFGVKTTMSQGPYFSLFPIPGTGWSWSADVKLALNIRRLVKGITSAERIILGKKVDQCELDKKDFFRRLASWSEVAHSLSKADNAECISLREKIQEIQAAYPEADFIRNPFSITPHLEPLASTVFKQDDGTVVQLGAGTVSVGSTGVSVALSHRGFTFYDSNKRPVNYQHDCSYFENFVNRYHQSVLPSYIDLVADGNCEVPPSTFPDMSFNDCTQAIPADASDSLPPFPRLVMDNFTGQIIKGTYSLCEECLGVRSYGMPCAYCSTGSSCVPFFRGILHLPCMGTLTKWPLRYFNALEYEVAHEHSIRLLCAVEGEELYITGDDGLPKKVSREEFKLRHDQVVKTGTRFYALPTESV
jgi:hypothetical protein